MADPWKKHLDDIIPYKPGKPVEEVKRELGLERVIKLASNESPLGPSPAAVKAISSAASNVNRYPDGGCYYLRKALSEKLSVDGDNIVFGNGSDEIILLALHSFVDPGDEVVVADPTFMIYHIASMVKNARLRTVPLKNYRYDLKGMFDAVSPRTKVIFIANPDNPTGTYSNDKELRDFVEAVPGNVLVFIDEAYYEYASGGDYPETIDLIKREDKNVLVARTFSKAYALAGLRVGYGLGRKNLIGALNKVREPFNVNSLAQSAAVAALGDQQYMRSSVELVKTEKERVYSRLKDLGLGYIPSLTNFVLINVKRDSSVLFDKLLKKGIIVRDMSAWKMEGFIRVNMGLPEENDAFLRSFEQVLKDLPELAG
jgi:histidinol-phosphate aminotransferase